MRPLTTSFLVLLVILGAPRGAHPGSTLLWADGPASATPPSKMNVDFAKLAAANEQAQKMLAEAQRAFAAQSVPTDCKMIKPIDPQFTSKMPVQTPDPELKLPIQTVFIPSCAK